MRSFYYCCAILAVLLSNHFSAFALSQTEPVQATLLAEDESIQPGRPFWIGVELKMADGWDTYWQNPGDSGFPTQVNWKLPEGFKAGPILWPYPEKMTVDGLVVFGYTESVLLMTQITPPAQLSGNQKIEIKADVNWLACKDSCVPGSASLELALPVTSADPGIDDSKIAVFNQARLQLPQKEGDFLVSAQADQFVLKFNPAKLGEIQEILFIPEDADVIDYAAPQIFKTEGKNATLQVKRAHSDTLPSSLKGIMLVSEKGNELKRAIQVDSAITASQVKSVEGVSSVAVALLFAFVGGLILNVMPCVLPVVALKIFGFVKMAGQKRSLILKHGGVFAGGVLISFWVLSGALLILRAYGEGIGWGFQLQEPVFVAILAGLLFLLGLSLFGVFELGTSLISLGSKPASSSGSPLKSSFMSGVLATLVATPCTGPLLGPALGFAMTLPPIQALLIFTGMGLGMAFPYLLFAAFPQLVKFLPKPGNWMITFKQIMGFLMMATVAWLIWVFGAQTDNMATFVLLAGLLIMAIGGWIYGTWGALNRKKITRMISAVIAALLIVTGGSAAIMTAKQHRDTPAIAQVASDSGWEAYSPQRVEELRAQGVPVFIDFTAKWCLICQANKVVLHSSSVEKAFKEKGVVTMTADWTKKDATITQELERLGRSGVPVYVLYPGNTHDRPVILPQTLTANVVCDYLDKLQTPTTTVNLTK